MGIVDRALHALSSIAQPGLDAWKVGNTVAGATRRQQRLYSLDRIYWGIQYDGAEWIMDDSKHGRPKPVLQRKPFVVSGMGGEVVDGYLSLLAGAGRSPEFSVKDDPGTAVLAANILRVGQFAEQLREALRFGLCPGTGVLVFSIRRGWPTFSTYHPAWCAPRFARDVDPKVRAIVEQFDLRPDDLAQMDVKFIRAGSDGKHYWAVEQHFPDRVIRFLPVEVVYGDAKAQRDPRPLNPKDLVIDPLNSADHGWGFIPAAWLTPLGRTGGSDGECLIGEPDGPISMLLRAFDYTMSMVTRSSWRNMEPIPFVKGIAHELLQEFRRNGGAIATTNLDATMELVTGALDGPRVGMELSAVLEKRVLSVLGYVRHDPSEGGQPSGEALRLKYAPMIARVQEWQGVIAPALVRFVGSVVRASKMEIARGPERMVDQVLDDGDGGKVRPSDGVVALQAWPEPFPLTVSDRRTMVDGYGAAKTLGVLSTESSVRMTATAYGLNPEEEWGRVQAETAARPADPFVPGLPLEG